MQGLGYHAKSYIVTTSATSRVLFIRGPCCYEACALTAFDSLSPDSSYSASNIMFRTSSESLLTSAGVMPLVGIGSNTEQE